MLTLYLWAILLLPTSDQWVCDLWTAQITREGVLAACGTLAVNDYRVDVYTLGMDKVVCSVMGDSLTTLRETCKLSAPLDNFVLRLMYPKEYQKENLLCFVESTSNVKPTDDEIRATCPQYFYNSMTRMQFAGVKPIEEEKEFACPSRAMQIGAGLYDQAQSPEALHTSARLDMLATKLIWNGIVTPDCGTGLNPSTLAVNGCGRDAAREAVTSWQNQFDAEIFSAAITYNVPGRLLKKMMMLESQFWIFWKPDPKTGEIGIMQITDNGFDVLYRFDPDLDPLYLYRSDSGKFYERSVTRDQLYCVGCKTEDALAHIKKTIPIYARILAAYHCRAAVINPSLVGSNDAWRQAVVDFNGSAEYLVKIEEEK